MSILGRILGRRIIVDEPQPTTFWVGIPHEAIQIISECDPIIAKFLANVALVHTEWPAPDPPVGWVRDIWNKSKN